MIFSRSIHSMNFKYQQDIQNLNLSVSCPPSNYKSIEIQAFRFVFEEGSEKAKNNFLPPLKITPKRQLNPDSKKCEGYALSLFNTQQKAKTFYGELRKRHPNIDKTLGTHLARGIFDKNDGVASEINNKGHFNFHEAEDTNLSQKFEIISHL